MTLKTITSAILNLPIIRNVPGFNTLPPSVNEKNLRFYKLCNLVQTLGMAVHAHWITLFIVMQATQMVYVNIFSVLLYILNIYINRRGYHFMSVVLMVAEIIIHQIIAIQYFGWEAGFQNYIIITSLVPFLMPQGKWILKSLLLLALLITYISLNYYSRNHFAEYKLNDVFLLYFSISNIVFAFTSMCISGGYFNLAMHETVVQLEQKTTELVASEKNATLGKIATEMAHEIQNPLNFVNNFSEINNELLQELKVELEANNANEAKYIVADLIGNSSKINENGKRVSKIVKELQRQANLIDNLGV